MDYLVNTLDMIQQRAHYSRYVGDWDRLRQQAIVMVDGGRAPADCYPAIRMVIEALNDSHSFFIGADEKDDTGPSGSPRAFGFLILSPENIVIEVFPESAADKAGIRMGDVIETVNGAPPPQSEGRLLRLDREKPLRLGISRRGESAPLQIELEASREFKSPAPQGRLLREGIGYIELFVQGDPNDQKRYIDTAQAIIRATSALSAKGWIVDLRRDRGGNMWPMLAGVGPILGEGELGVFVGHEGPKERWFYQDGASQYQDPKTGELHVVAQATNPVAPSHPETTPVALLISDLTESAGEMITVAFLGRPNTRSFGQPTRGLTTAVAMHDLEDGAILGIAETVCADRTGKVYDRVIEPDEVMPIDWRRYGGDDDPVIVAAAEWLDAQLNDSIPDNPGT